MKLIHPLLIATLSLSTLNSCIQDEPLNAECDITGVDETWYNHYAHLNATEQNPEGENIWIGKVKINEETHRISFTVKLGTDRSSFAPVFNLMPYTRITAKVNGEEVADANGITRDFTTPQIYTTHSQDGNWHKDYTVAFNYPMAIGEMNFANFKEASANPNNPKSPKFYTWQEVDSLGNELEYWATGNAGYAMTGTQQSKDSKQYPTVHETPEGDIYPIVRLTTCDTGEFGKRVHMPIAAGSIFIGTFDSKYAMKKPREATAFGLQVLKKTGRPMFLEGSYKYKSGDVFTDENKEKVEGRRDMADIYAVVYEVDPNNFKPLNGDDVLSSDRIVLMARIDNPGEPKEWTDFREEFKQMNGKAFDLNRLAEDGYAIAVVATSSRDGAYFKGAIGSTLRIKHLRVVYENDIKE